MSKKRFTEGMEGLFAGEGDNLLRAEENKQKREHPAPEKRAGVKDFSSELHAFLQEAFDESFEEQLSAKTRPGNLPKPERKALSGVDVLIRNTLEPASLSIDPAATRRLVVTFREAQLDKLREIAKMEKTYLKKIINDIVEEFIAAYRKGEKG